MVIATVKPYLKLPLNFKFLYPFLLREMWKLEGIRIASYLFI